MTLDESPAVAYGATTNRRRRRDIAPAGVRTSSRSPYQGRKIAEAASNCTAERVLMRSDTPASRSHGTKSALACGPRIPQATRLQGRTHSFKDVNAVLIRALPPGHSSIPRWGDRTGGAAVAHFEESGGGRNAAAEEVSMMDQGGWQSRTLQRPPSLPRDHDDGFIRSAGCDAYLGRGGDPALAKICEKHGVVPRRQHGGTHPYDWRSLKNLIRERSMS